MVCDRTAAAFPPSTFPAIICAVCARMVRCAPAICDCVMHETPKAGRAPAKSSAQNTTETTFFAGIAKRLQPIQDFPSIRKRI